MSLLRTVAVSRYVTPLREGGSLPAIVEADDSGLYVLKFRGAGHGPLALIAELVCGELGRAAGLPIPEIVLATLDAELARTEPDPEIHALIHDSAGLNLALDYLPGAVNFDPIVHPIPAELASRIVWFDAFISNVDRTARNTNMLMWHRSPYLIDHGSALYFHHSPEWGLEPTRARSPFPQVAAHVLLRSATMIADVDAAMTQAMAPEVIDAVLNGVPAEWLVHPGMRAGTDGDAARRAYRTHLVDRLAAPRPFVEEAVRVR